MRDYRVIDADGHVQEAGIPWADLLEPPFRDRAPRSVQDNRGVTRLLIEGKLWPKPEGLGTGFQLPWYRRGPVVAGATDPHARLRDMDTEGLDVEVLFGTTVFLSLPFLEDRDLACALARVYNNWVADYCRADPTRLKAVALLPMQEPAEAARELRRAVTELGMVGATTTAHAGGRNLDDPAFYPVYAEAERLGVPLCVHVGAGRPAAGADRFRNFFMTHTLCHAFEQMIGMVSLIGGGILELYPALRVAFLEAGCGWVPYWLERMDEQYEMLHAHVPLCKHEPSYYARSGRVYVSFEAEERALPWVMQAWDENQLVLATDYGHPDAMFPETVRHFEARTDVPEAAKPKLLGANAARLFNL